MTMLFIGVYTYVMLIVAIILMVTAYPDEENDNDE